MSRASKRGLRSYPSKGTTQLGNGVPDIKNVGGSMLFVASADQDFRVRFSNGSEFPAGQNFKVFFPEGSEYDHFEIINDSGSNLNYRIIAGFGDVDIAGDVITSVTMPVMTTGGQGIAHDQVDVDSSADLILAANSNGTGYSIRNNSSDTVYLGGSGVTTADGFPLKEDEVFSWDSRAALYGITASGTVDVRIISGTVS